MAQSQYRSPGTGVTVDLGSATNWQVSTDGGVTWNPASVAPTGSIALPSGSTITIKPSDIWANAIGTTTIPSGVTLVNNSSAALGTFTTNALVCAAGSTLVYSGTTAQALPSCAAFQGQNISNITINNASGVSETGGGVGYINLNGVITLTNGTFTCNITTFYKGSMTGTNGKIKSTGYFEPSTTSSLVLNGNLFLNNTINSLQCNSTGAVLTTGPIVATNVFKLNNNANAVAAFTLGGALTIGATGTNLGFTGTANPNYGSITAGTNMVTFNGTASQAIPAGYFTSNTVNNLTIGNSTTGVTSAGSLNIGSSYTVAFLKSAIIPLAVTGTATIGGALTIGSFSAAPTAGQTFTVLSATAVSGTFSSLVLPAGYTGTLTYSGTSVTLTINTVPSSDATLSAMSLSNGTLSPIFTPSTTSYTASVANNISSVTLTPTVNQANATIKVNGTTVASGSPSGNIALNVGTNTVTTVITAQNHITTQTYTTTVIRQAPLTNPGIAPYLFGENVQLPKQIGNKKNTGGLMDKFFPAIQQSGVKIMRYGGVGFETNVTDSTVSIADLINKVDSMRAHGIEPILTAPLYYGTGSHVHTILQGASQARRIMRSVNMHYGSNPVTKWVISNEPDGGLHNYNTSSGPDSIRTYIAAYSDSLRAEAAANGYTVTLYGPELSYYRFIDQLTDPTSSNTYILDKIDVFTWHVYPFGNQAVQSNSSPISDRNGLIRQLAFGAPLYGGGTSTPLETSFTYLKQRIAASNNPNVKIGITEANVCFQQDASGTNATPGTDLTVTGNSACGFIGGQFWAELMSVCMKNSIDYLTFWSIIEGGGSSTTYNIGYIDAITQKLKPSYHHFSMVANNFSGVYCTGLDSLKIDGGAKTDADYIKVFGSKDVSKNKISVMIMNQSQSQGYSFTLHLGINAPAGQDNLDTWIDANLSLKSHRDSIPPQATLLVVFDANGNEVSNCLYTQDDATNGRLPNCVSAAVIAAGPVTVAVDTGRNTASNVVLTQPTASDRYGIKSITNDAPTNYPVGNTTVTWTATDVYGNTGTATQLVTVLARPAVSITAPANNSVVPAGSNITINADASNPNSGGSIAKVDFYNGTTLLGTSTTTPYTYVLNNVPVGKDTLTAVATDNKGFTNTSAPFIITVSTPPVVAITAPTDTVVATGSNIVIKANASSPDMGGTIAKVDFYNGTILLGTSTDAPYNYTWNNLIAGTDTLKAVATDNNGLTTTSSNVIITVSDPPAISLTAPANNSVMLAGSDVVITAYASSPNTGGNITKVDFYNGTTLLGTSTKAPYSYTWNNTLAGTHALTAVATDNNRLTTTSAAITITVVVPPVVTLTAPINNSIVTAGSSVTITADASSPNTGDNIAKVDFYNGTILLGTSTNAPYSYAWNNLSAGTDTLKAVATDNNGFTTTSSNIIITVNQPPSVALITPAANASFYAPADVTINANATDADGSIVKVEFFQGTTKLGEVLTAPYSFNWTNVPAGNYAITANATDNRGAITTSAVINITVTTRPVLQITIPDMYALNPATDTKNTIYIGYGPTSFTLTPSVQGGQSGYTYSWSNGATTSSIVVSQAGTYTVNVSSADGGLGSATIVIDTIDVRCGIDNTRVKVCHNQHVICVAQAAVQEHLNHRDKLGACGSDNKAIAYTSLSNDPGTLASTSTLAIYPNPVDSFLHIVVPQVQPNASIHVYSFSSQGKEVLTVNLTQAQQDVSFQGLAPGYYFLVIKNGSKTIQKTLIKN